ncbi:MAG: hypothetical protein HC843_04605 [Sphingomonadales bacterium]|nr:hypothetical protein [Sphingomonadales bacterium]
MSDAKTLAARKKELQAQLRDLENQEQLTAQKQITDKSLSILTDILPQYTIGKITKAQAKKLGEYLSKNGIEQLLQKM